MNDKPIIASGLEGVIAGRTSICKIDEDQCELFYGGYSIDDLASNSNFEEVTYLLLCGELPDKKGLEDFCNELSAEREIPTELINIIKELPGETDPMDVLKIAVGILHTSDPDGSSNTDDANMRKAVRLIAKIPTIITHDYRITNDMEPVEPDARLSLASNFLYMLNGEEPESYKSDVLDKSLILYAEHGLNASTFAARVVVSTLSDLHSSVMAAIGALKGPLHGGANERVMEMLLKIGDVEKVEPWIKQALSEKKRIMGFGHRVYKKQDPRNLIIKGLVKELGERLGNNKWFEMSQKMEDVVTAEKGLHPNLDFYSSSAYYLLGIPIPLYTPIFVASRVTGWIAHVMEQYNDNRLIRPRSEYVGHEKRKYVPIEDR
ncbi:MAG: Citrate synthase [Candidatus Scalindua rubra]|uniref:Citrate synthase n=1 Tax=Candidatus Scalindua rubra TaxID=1872076 RepID=A0A1E3XBD4_9BACT|nr:MAG: Citrate synthase [Candidatus Scalindua rubra]